MANGRIVQVTRNGTKRKGRKNEEKEKIATKYSDEMKLISKKALSFFDTYLHLKIDELSGNEKFKLELQTVISIIKKRVEIEEKELFPLYEKAKK